MRTIEQMKIEHELKDSQRVVIYALLANNKVFYVGKTSQPLNKRLSEHKLDRLNAAKFEMFKSNKVTIKQLLTTDYLNSSIEEDKAISHYLSIGCKLTNIKLTHRKTKKVKDNATIQREIDIINKSIELNRLKQYIKGIR